VNDGRWRFVVGVYDTVNHDVRYYLDGIFEAGYTELQSLLDNPIALIIGDENNHLYAFDGEIDDVRFYDRVLSDAEIWALWSVGQ
jgi:hypothetical protein